MIENLDPVVFYCLIGGFSFLIAVTILVALSKAYWPENKTLGKVWQILGGWWLLSVLLGTACLVGSTGLVIFFFFVSLLGLKEFLDAQKLSFVGPLEKLALVAIVTAHYTFIFLGLKNFYLFILPLMTYVYVPFLMLRRRKIDDLVQNLWATQSGVMLCVYFLSFAPGLLFLNVNPTAVREIEPVAAFLFLFITTEMNDVFQFISGKSFGRRKLAEEISPNKTVAGFIGGIVLTSLLSAILAPMILDLNIWQSVLLGGCISLSGISGDLMFSSIKRTAGVKDFSQLIPGHGGALDRFDSMVFTAPTLYSLIFIFIHT